MRTSSIAREEQRQSDAVAGAGLHLTGASKGFGERTLWSDLAFTLPAGKMLAVTGSSGSGKTTLLNCLGLLDTFDAGTMTLDGEVLSGASSRRQRYYRRRELGYLFQNYALIENATIGENLDVATGKMRLFRARTPADYETCLKAVGLEGRSKAVVFSLSGGEQQRVAVARLMLKKPKLILADEPTGALDTANAQVVLGFLRRMAQEGSVIVLATHSQDVAQSCDLRLDLG